MLIYYITQACDSLNSRLKELTGQLDQKDTELDQEVDDIFETDLDELEKTIEGSKDRARKEADDALNSVGDSYNF